MDPPNASPRERIAAALDRIAAAADQESPDLSGTDARLDAHPGSEAWRCYVEGCPNEPVYRCGGCSTPERPRLLCRQHAQWYAPALLTLCKVCQMRFIARALDPADNPPPGLWAEDYPEPGPFDPEPGPQEGRPPWWRRIDDEAGD